MASIGGGRGRMEGRWIWYEEDEEVN